MLRELLTKLRLQNCVLEVCIQLLVYDCTVSCTFVRGLIIKQVEGESIDLQVELKETGSDPIRTLFNNKACSKTLTGVYTAQIQIFSKMMIFYSIVTH